MVPASITGMTLRLPVDGALFRELSERAWRGCRAGLLTCRVRSKPTGGPWTRSPAASAPARACSSWPPPSQRSGSAGSKMDHRMTGSKELSRLLELELLYLGIEGKHGLWRSLDTLHDARLAQFDFPKLAARAREQLAGLSLLVNHAESGSDGLHPRAIRTGAPRERAPHNPASISGRIPPSKDLHHDVWRD
jgi:hypothetical protein